MPLRRFREFLEHGRNARRFQALPPRQREIVFYAEYPGDWAHMGPVVESLRRDFDRSVCCLVSDPHDPMLRSEDPGIRAFLIGHETARTMLFRSLSDALVVMTTPDLDRFPHMRRSAQPGCHYAYLFHSLPSTHMLYSKGAFDHYDTIFCVGPHHMDEIRATERHYDLPEKTLVAQGYVRLDDLLRERQSVPPPEAFPGGYRVLVAPTWGASGLLASVGEQLIQSLLADGHHVTLRTHPMTNRDEPELLEPLLKRFGLHPAFAHDRDLASKASLYASHMLISDWSGIAYEFAFSLLRPVLFMDTPPDPSNPEHRAIGLTPIEFSLRNQVGDVLALEEVGDAPATVRRLCDRPAAMGDEIVAARERTVFNSGRSALVAAQWISDFLDRERRSSPGAATP